MRQLNADVIIAWAEGKVVQYTDQSDQSNSWIDYDFESSGLIIGHEDYRWRVKGVIVNALGEEVRIIDRKSGGFIIQVNFFDRKIKNTGKGESYLGYITNFNNDFVNQNDMMEAIDRTIKEKYTSCNEVVISYYHD